MMIINNLKKQKQHYQKKIIQQKKKIKQIKKLKVKQKILKKKKRTILNRQIKKYKNNQ